jgi:hypothetical protein
MPTAAIDAPLVRRRARAGRPGGRHAATPDLPDAADVVARIADREQMSTRAIH